MKIIINKDGNITVEVEEYNTEEIAEMIQNSLHRSAIKNVEIYYE